MVKIIRLNSIFCIFILASCHTNKNIEGVDWDAPNNLPTYVVVDLDELHLTTPPPIPNIELPSLADVPPFTPTNKPDFIPPPPPFNFIIDFGD